MQWVPVLALFNSYITTKIDADDTSVVLKSVTDIPTAPFYGVLDGGSSSEELVLVTAVTTATKTLTVTRAQGGTTGVAHAVDTMFHYCQLNAAQLRSVTLLDEQNAVFGTDGDVYMGVRAANSNRWNRSFIDTDAQDTHGLPIGETAGSSDIYAVRFSFKWGTGESSGSYSKRTTGVFMRLEIDQDLSNSGDVRAAHVEVKTAGYDIGGGLVGQFIDVEAQGACTVGEGESATETYPVMVGLDIRMRTTTAAVNLINTTNSQGYAALLHLHPYFRHTLDGNLSGIHISSPYEEHGSDIQGTSYAILLRDDESANHDWDYGIYIADGTCVYEICVPGIPTSDPGVAGVLYSDSNTIKVSTG